ncbi:hypothetical protein ACIPY2_13425 [Paenarthrobacter sp. NPDC089675]|uniref:hypothetical protein n=1 Tax=Paenarthrobacter sp. NPDC089675 TaxID=3364376 RepID=UPI0037F80EDE
MFATHEAAFGFRSAAVVATVWTGLVTLALAVFATITTQAGWGVIAMTAASACSVAALCLVLLGRIPTEWVLRGPFAFRPAAQRPTSGHVLTTFMQLVVFWGLFLGVIPLVLFALEKRWALAVPFPLPTLVPGVVLLLLASALGISSAIAMSTNGNGTQWPARWCGITRSGRSRKPISGFDSGPSLNATAKGSAAGFPG